MLDHATPDPTNQDRMDRASRHQSSREVEGLVNTFELSSISEHDQLATELVRRGQVIAQFYRSMIEEGLPTDLAGTIVLEWARASFQAGGAPDCGCDCDICRGEA